MSSKTQRPLETPPPASFLQFVAEVQAVCEKYNVMLLGSCATEGIAGEIEIAAAPWHAPGMDPYASPWNHVFWHPLAQTWVLDHIGPPRFQRG